jgi:diguanylate cyclase (GGDEF)-like protein
MHETIDEVVTSPLSGNRLNTAAGTESTLIQKGVLRQYEGALRELRHGHYAVQLPPVRSLALEALGNEIGGLADLLRQKFDQSARLGRMALDIGAGLFLDDILDRVYESFRGVIPFDRIGCALLDRSDMSLRARWARTEAPSACITRGYSQPLAGSSLEAILATGQPRILNDLPGYLAAHPASDSTRLIVEEGMRSSFTCPLVSQDSPVGFLFFSSFQPDTYDDEHAGIFQQIAGQLASVIEKGVLYERLHRLNGELIDAQARLEHDATHDELTGLPNRRAMLEALASECARAVRDGRRFGVLVIDVDHFKQINDRYGHPVGDAVLYRIANALAATVRAGEKVGRLGGEEFVAVILARNDEDLRRAGERLRVAVESATTPWQDMVIRATVSIGAALAAAGCADPQGSEVLARADRALYRAKAAGRNVVEVADSNPVTGQ